MADDPVQEAFERLRTQFAVLVAAGYAGGPLAGEQGTYRISVPFSGRVYEGITVVSNLPSLPYGASPTRLVQAAVFNWLYCGHPDLPVLTGELEWVPLGSLKVGQRLISFDESAGVPGRRLRWGTICRRDVVHQPAVRLVTARGHELVVGETHAWLWRPASMRAWGWKAAGEIQPGDHLAWVCEPWSTPLMEPSLYLRGWLDGEGGVTHHAISYSQAPNEALGDSIIALQRLGFTPSVTVDKDGFYHVSVTSMREGWRLLGQVRPRRLLKNHDKGWLNRKMPTHPTRVVAAEPCGIRELVNIEVDARTYIAGGYATHNCLTGKLAGQAPEIAMLHQHYRWEIRMRQASEESRQLRAFREYLAEKASELGEGGDTLGILRELREVAGEAPTPSLYLKCTQAVADNPIVRKTVATLTGSVAGEFSAWLEPFVYG